MEIFKQNCTKELNGISLKLIVLNWTKVKLKDWNEFQSNLEGTIWILA